MIPCGERECKADCEVCKELSKDKDQNVQVIVKLYYVR